MALCFMCRMGPGKAERHLCFCEEETMEFRMLYGQRAGKGAMQWQHLLQAVRDALLKTGAPVRVLAVGFFPNKPDMTATITFEVTKLTSTSIPAEPTLEYLDEMSQFTHDRAILDKLADAFMEWWKEAGLPDDARDASPLAEIALRILKENGYSAPESD